MVLLKFSNENAVIIPFKIKINPFSVLEISNNESTVDIKKKFREKINEIESNDEFKAKICLAYDIMINSNYYIKLSGENHYYITNDKYPFCHGYYHSVVGNLNKLIDEVEKNSNYITFKDPLGRSLLYIAAIYGHVSICEYLLDKGISINDIENSGNTPLHGASYYGQINVVKLLLSYGAKTNIKNKLGHLPKDEAMTKEVNNIFIENEEDPILKIYKSLSSKNIAEKLIPISRYYPDNIVAKKIICKLNNLPEQYKSLDIEKNWITAWHGTKFKYLKSIAEFGLKPAGGKLDNGREIGVRINHIGRDQTVDSIPDWANAIFVSPSIFYAACPAYAKEISYKNEQWKVLVEVRVKPNSYFERNSTYKKYVPKKNEPKMVEYRIDANNEKDVQVYSLTFVKSNFFKVPNYEYGKFLYENS